MEAYERSEHERQLLHLLARGEQEITAGKGFDLDEVLAEADALLPVAPSESSGSHPPDESSFSRRCPIFCKTIRRPPSSSGRELSAHSDASRDIRSPADSFQSFRIFPFAR